MKKLIAAKINTGKSIHIANLGDKTYHISCGSKSHGTKAKIYDTGLEAIKENITCKKCLKTLEEITETQEIDKNSQEYRIAKLKEMAEKEENEEQEMMAALKKAHENNEQFILKK